MVGEVHTTYLTKRDLVSKSQKAIREASERAYEFAGFVVKKTRKSNRKSL